MIQTASNKENNGQLAGEKSRHIQEARGRLIAERLQFYERLNGMTGSPTLQKVFTIFGISFESKKRKARLLDVLCKYLPATEWPQG